jgi:putative methyltransferase (TIGR04325 family)
VRELIRQICPPLIWQAIGRARQAMSPPPTRMFGGVHAAFAEIVDQQPWGQPGYLEMARGQLREAPAIHPTARTAHAILTLLINTLPGERPPRILDWGGGTGLRYWTTRPALNRAVDWLVVDDPALAAISHAIKGATPELAFASALPVPAQPFDLVLVFSSLQYVEDQEALLAALASHRPRFIVLPRMMALPDRSYVTRQVMLGHATPCKVSSIEAVTRALAGAGYQRMLQMRDGFDLTPMFDDDVPVELRAGQEWLLVFRGAA